MKKHFILILLTGIFTGLFISCNDDDKYTPTPPEISIENLTGTSICLPGETIELKAKLDNPLPTTFSWHLNEESVSSDSIYRFTAPDFGSFTVILTATNTDGTDSDTLAIEVTDGNFRFSSIKNWTGEGENISALAIQWITGEELIEPADDEVFFLAWGYRWKKEENPTGIDMLKAVVKNDPRLYIILAEQWGGLTVKGFGYDGNNDGKIEIKNASLHLTQDDFVDGIYMQPEGSDIDGFELTDPKDYWMGGWYNAYASYWLSVGNAIPETDEFYYSSLIASGRYLENESWDAWTFSAIDYSSMLNTPPFPRLIQAAEANK